MIRLATVVALFAGVLAMAGSSAPGMAAEPSVPTSKERTAHELNAADLESFLDGLLNYGLKNGDIAGAVVSVVKDGKTLFESGYGLADVEQKIPMDAERTLTRIGSTSKLFTWTSVMQLVEQGKLDLDRNVDDYLDFKVSPPGGPAITLLDLMNHRGGFEEGLKDLLALDPRGLMSTQSYLKQHPRPLVFKPGTVPAYSNYGTALAGYIVERVSGEPFEKYVDKHIFQPLGMQHSTFEQPLPERFKGMASRGYRSASLPPEPYELVTTAPAGSVATTASDMTRFMLAHLQQGHLDSYDLLKPGTAQLMHSPSESAPPNFATMAHGFFSATRNGRLVIGHGGDTIFFHTEMDLLPQEHVGIFYSFNSRGQDQSVYGLREAVLEQFLDRYFPEQSAAAEPATLPSAAADAQRIAGRYESSRRVEHGFLSVFYLLQQTVIAAAADGTLVAPKAFGSGEARFREIAPDTWRQVGGTRELGLRQVDGLKTVIDSDDPTSVLQAVPGLKAAPLNLTLLSASLLILVAAVILWPITYWVMRSRTLPVSAARRWRRLLRIAALYDIAWCIAWVVVLAPILSSQVDFYSSAHDSLIRTLQIGGMGVVAVAVLGVYSVWRLRQCALSKSSFIGNALIAAALLGMTWIGFIGRLISFNLNY